jgi:hypothetical protein
MKVLLINAAPRMESGNTQVILNPFLVGMRQEGAEIDIALLARKDINPCIGCFTCYAKTPGVCIYEDEMVGLVKRLQAADMLILATPVYLDGMTSFAKIFLDRLVVCLDPHFTTDRIGLIHPLRCHFPEKMFLVSVCGYPLLHNFDPLLAQMNKLARNFHSEFSGALLRPASFSLLLTKKYPEKIHSVLDAMRSAGSELALRGKISHETFLAAAEDICSTEELVETANSYWDRELSEE